MRMQIKWATNTPGNDRVGGYPYLTYRTLDGGGCITEYDVPHEFLSALEFAATGLRGVEWYRLARDGKSDNS